jgi:hypothetical protein
MEHTKQDKLSLFIINLILSIFITDTWILIIVGLIPGIRLYHSMEDTIVYLGMAFIILSTVIILYGGERYMIYISYFFTIVCIAEAIIYFTTYNIKSQTLSATYIAYIFIFVVNSVVLSIKFLVKNISYRSLMFILLLLVVSQNVSFLLYQTSEAVVQKHIEKNTNSIYATTTVDDVNIQSDSSVIEAVEKNEQQKYLDSQKTDSNGFTDNSSVSGGVITDGKVLSKIRTGEQPGFERIVFDIYERVGSFGSNDLKASNTACHYDIKYSKTNNSMTIILSGVRFSNVPRIVNVKTPLINYIKQIVYDDDSAFCYEISFKQEILYKAYVLQNPARVVIDIKSK